MTTDVTQTGLWVIRQLGAFYRRASPDGSRSAGFGPFEMATPFLHQPLAEQAAEDLDATAELVLTPSAVLWLRAWQLASEDSKRAAANVVAAQDILKAVNQDVLRTIQAAGDKLFEGKARTPDHVGRSGWYSIGGYFFFLREVNRGSRWEWEADFADVTKLD
jgi:hypothetical protein